MKFIFKTQQYQVDAVNAVCDVFKGQPFISNEEYTRDRGTYKPKPKDVTLFNNDTIEEEKNVKVEDDDIIGFSNASIKLDNSTLLNNIKNIQIKNNIHESSKLFNGLGNVELDVEMETGTGKTYVYTRTIFELNKQYGWSKFIIVVPSIAIREGVLKSLEQTQDHFMQEYGKKIRFFVYNSKNLRPIDDFSKDNSIHVMIINIQAFNTGGKEGRKINEEVDDFYSRRPIDVLAKNRPILILDEPQKMGGKATRESLPKFNPLFVVNFSATHKEQHNLVYVLDALDAYNQKLVKKIEVKGVQIKNLRGTTSYLYLQDIKLSENKPPKAVIEFEIDRKKSINRETKILDVGDNIYHESNQMEQYKDGYVISEINPITNTVTFLNGDVLSKGESAGDVSEDDIRRIQIRETIISHLDKEEELFNKGIKVLSLFFIDEVSKYRVYDENGDPQLGDYAKIFEEEYKLAVKNKISMMNTPYDNYLKSIDLTTTHNGYFSIDKKGRMCNSSLKRNSDESDDISAYDLILKDKERLLSFEEPTRFIFSHSALSEGWDNPNVFQICTLKHSSNDLKRRQEVGRGLRICVNKFGERMDSSNQLINFHQINKLTIIANESYEQFVKGLQSQIKENLFNRPTKISTEYFVNKTIRDNNGNNDVKITADQANKIIIYLAQNQYIDSNGNVTDKFKEDSENKCVTPLPESLLNYSDNINNLIRNVYDNSVGVQIGNGYGTTVTTNSLNKNFDKKEFKDLWNAINHKYSYTVQFDTNELVKNSILAIDNELKDIASLQYTVSVGSQKESIAKTEIDSDQSFNIANTKHYTLSTIDSSNVTYDLIGKIKEKTSLTRKTVASILKGINPIKFGFYKVNPEEFIKKVSNIINEQKSTLIVEHVTYNETKEDPFDTNIFAEEKSKAAFIKAFKTKKGIQDYLFEDSTGERKFAEELDNADEVVVYGKLPRGFYIPTPVGNYSPDWAIAFKDGSVKHVYFVAETKGSLSNMQLRKIEDAKIKCASKLFEKISNCDVKYGKVTNYQDLMNILK